MLTCLRDCPVECRPLASSHLRGKTLMAVTLDRHSVGLQVNTEGPGTSRSHRSSQSTVHESVSPQASPVHCSKPLSEEKPSKTSKYTDKSTNSKEHAHNSHNRVYLKLHDPAFGRHYVMCDSINFLSISAATHHNPIRRVTEMPDRAIL